MNVPNLPNMAHVSTGESAMNMRSLTLVPHVMVELWSHARAEQPDVIAVYRYDPIMHNGNVAPRWQTIYVANKQDFVSWLQTNNVEQYNNYIRWCLGGGGAYSTPVKGGSDYAFAMYMKELAEAVLSEPVTIKQQKKPRKLIRQGAEHATDAQ